MAAKKISRKELLKRPDEFQTLSSRAILFYQAHSTLFSYIGVGIVILIGIYLGINTYMKYVNKKGQTAYNKAYYALADDQNAEEGKEDLKHITELFEKVKDSYGLSKASRLALPELAHLKFREGKYDEAIALYKEFLADAYDDHPYEDMTKLALAACYEEKGDLKEATELLKQLIDDPNFFFEEQAMLSLARVYRLSDQPEKSHEILKEFAEKYDSSPFLPQVKAQLQAYGS
jgi:predicted negative regulator of RcsB-dependent stress response